MAKKHVVAATSEIPPGGRKLVTADGRAIVVFNLGGEFFALSNRCPHRGGSLCQGNLTGLVLSDQPGEYNGKDPHRQNSSRARQWLLAYRRNGIGLCVGIDNFSHKLAV